MIPRCERKGRRQMEWRRKWGVHYGMTAGGEGGKRKDTSSPSSLRIAMGRKEKAKGRENNCTAG